MDFGFFLSLHLLIDSHLPLLRSKCWCVPHFLWYLGTPWSSLFYFIFCALNLSCSLVTFIYRLSWKLFIYFSICVDPLLLLVMPINPSNWGLCLSLLVQTYFNSPSLCMTRVSYLISWIAYLIENEGLRLRKLKLMLG